MTVRDVLQAIERIAPRSFAFSFDKIGLQVGDANHEVTRAVVSLDHSLEAVDFAVSIGANLFIAHHPLIFDPLTSVVEQDRTGRVVRKLVRHDISFIAAHTNWDVAPGGVNDALALALGLEDIEPFGSRPESRRLKVVVFVPEEAADEIIDAASKAGAGRIGLYERCAYQSDGTGTFLGLEGSDPAVGEPGKVEVTAEVRLEMELPASRKWAVDSAVREAHPYEEPVIDFYVLESSAAGQIGRVGRLPQPLALRDFVKLAEERLETWCLTWGDPDRVVSTVGVVGGAADAECRHCRTDVFLTGEVKQHLALEGIESGLAMVSAGHYATEQPGVVALAARLADEVPGLKIDVFVPPAGFAGRPLK